jgi:hypothetical protein
VDEIKLPHINAWGRFMELDSEPISNGFWRSIPILRALMQPAGTVTLRLPPHRFLSAPCPIHPFAAEDWQLACLSREKPLASRSSSRLTARSSYNESSAEFARFGRPLLGRSPALHKSYETPT